MARTHRRVWQHRVVAIRYDENHIERIRVTNASGTKMMDWSVADAIVPSTKAPMSSLWPTPYGRQ